MATKAEAKEATVKIRLFKDGGKYKDDAVVIHNGTVYQIQRGVTVDVPVIVADILEQSMEQDSATAEMITRMSNEFRQRAKEVGV